MKDLIITSTLLFILFSSKAFAGSLFYEDACVAARHQVVGGRVSSGSMNVDKMIVAYKLVGRNHSITGLTCEQMKNFSEAFDLIKFTVVTATVALKTPAVRAALTADLVSLGLTIANPAILAVSVVGAGGIVTFYVILKMDMAECEKLERKQLRDSILEELKSTYNVRNSNNLDLTIQH